MNHLKVGANCWDVIHRFKYLFRWIGTEFEDATCHISVSRGTH